MLATDINRSTFEVEKVKNLLNNPYANLLYKCTNNAKIAETIIRLDAMSCTGKSITIRVLTK